MRKATMALQKVTMLLPADLVKAAKHLAVERSAPGQRVTMTQVVCDALREHLKRGGRS
jgi:hypothetical protein